MRKITNINPAELIPAVNIIAKDADDCEAAMKLNDTQFSRRMWIRAYFSWVEAYCYLLRRYVLQLKFSKRVIKPSDIAEFAALNELKYSVTQKGESIAEPANTRTVDYIGFSLMACARLDNLGLSIDPGGKDRKCLVDAVRIRDRITHPKGVADVNITDADMKTVYDFKNWFFGHLEILHDPVIKKAIKKTAGIAKRTKKERRLVFDETYFKQKEDAQKA